MLYECKYRAVQQIFPVPYLRLCEHSCSSRPAVTTTVTAIMNLTLLYRYRLMIRYTRMPINYVKDGIKQLQILFSETRESNAKRNLTCD